MSCFVLVAWPLPGRNVYLSLNPFEFDLPLSSKFMVNGHCIVHLPLTLNRTLTFPRHCGWKITSILLHFFFATTIWNHDFIDISFFQVLTRNQACWWKDYFEKLTQSEQCESFTMLNFHPWHTGGKFYSEVWWKLGWLTPLLIFMQNQSSCENVVTCDIMTMERLGGMPHKIRIWERWC